MARKRRRTRGAGRTEPPSDRILTLRAAIEKFREERDRKAEEARCEAEYQLALRMQHAIWTVATTTSRDELVGAYRTLRGMLACRCHQRYG